MSETDSFLARVARAPELDPEAGVGQRLDRYQLLRRLGAGSYGVVYEAEDTELGRRVAVKVLREDWRGDARALSRLRQEAITVARLNHPNIVVLHDHGNQEGVPFLVFELIDGASLREWLASAARSPAETIAIFRDAARGLAAAHREGLIHRDFKPANVLVGRDGAVRVADFGLARASAATEVGEPATAPTATTRAGTPRYMAPEAQRGEPVSARADQYAFCVALDEALGARCPAWLRPVLARGTQADPASRHPSMDALVAALRPPPPVWPWVLTGALGLAALVLVFLRGTTPSCVADPAQLEGVWDVPRRGEVRTAFGAKLGEHLRFAGLVDSYATAWSGARVEACRATRAGEQSAQALDLRMACLDQRREALAALTITVGAGGVPADVAIRAAVALPSIDGCAAISSLLAADPFPAGQHDEAVRLTRLVEQARLLHRLVRVREALPLAALAHAWATTLHHAPLEAQALYVLGLVSEYLGDPPGAERLLRQGLDRAIDGRDLPFAGRILSYLVVNVGRMQGRWDEAERIGALALSVTREWDPAPRSEAATYLFLALVASSRGDYEEALRRVDRAQAADRRMSRREPAFEAEHWNTRAGILRRLDRRDEGIEAYGIAAALHAASPETRASVSVPLFNMGALAADEGDWDTAIARLEQAGRLFTEAEGPDGPRVLRTQVTLARALAGRGETARALALADSAIARLRQKKLGPGELAGLEGEHAAVLRRVRPADARQALATVLEAQVAALGLAHPEAQQTRLLLASWRLQDEGLWSALRTIIPPGS